MQLDVKVLNEHKRGTLKQYSSNYILAYNQV